MGEPIKSLQKWLIIHGVVRIEEGDLVLRQRRQRPWKQRLPKQRILSIGPVLR